MLKKQCVRQDVRQVVPPEYCRTSNLSGTPNLPTNVIPTEIACLKLSGKLPVGLGIPLLRIEIMLESNPLKSIMLVRRLAVGNNVLEKSVRQVAPPDGPPLCSRLRARRAPRAKAPLGAYVRHK